MANVVLRVFGFFKRIVGVLWVLLGLVMLLGPGLLRDSPQWANTLVLLSVSVLGVIVGTILIVTSVENGRASRKR